MNLLRFRPVSKTLRLELPDGSTRPVKVTVNDAHTTQHVEDGEVVHGTAKPPPLRIVVRKGHEPIAREEYKLRECGLWAPVPGTVEALTR